MLHVTYVSQILGCTSYVIYCMLEMHCILFWVHPNISHMSTCHLLDVTCHMLHVTSYMLHITCLMLHVICHKCLAFCSEFIQIYLTCQPVTCYMLHVTCYTSHVTWRISHVTCCMSHVIHYMSLEMPCMHACFYECIHPVSHFNLSHVTCHASHVTCHL